MLHSKSLVMILFAILATAPFQIVTGAAIVSTLSPRLPHPVGIMEYTGIINGREVQLNGTVQVQSFLRSLPRKNSLLMNKRTKQEIRSQIQTLYPELNHLNSVAATREISTVELRSKSTLNCLPIGNWGWTGAYQFPIVQSIAFLNSIPGSEQQSACYVGAGPATCVRIACLDNSGIWLCNDVSPPPTYPHFLFLCGAEWY